MRTILLLLVLVIHAVGTAAWGFSLKLDGLVTDYATGKAMQARVRVYKNGALAQVCTTKANGKYAVSLDNGADYVVRVDAPGYQGKCITIVTQGAEWAGDRRVRSLEVEIRLPGRIYGTDLSSLDLPLGIARFEPATGHVRWSQTYERNIQAEVRQAMALYDRLARASGQLASTRLHGSILVEALVL